MSYVSSNQLERHLDAFIKGGPFDHIKVQKGGAYRIEGSVSDEVDKIDFTSFLKDGYSEQGGGSLGLSDITEDEELIGGEVSAITHTIMGIENVNKDVRHRTIPVIELETEEETENKKFLQFRVT